MANFTGLNAALKKDLTPILEKYGINCIVAVMIQTANCQSSVPGRKELSKVRSFFLNRISVDLDSDELQERWIGDFIAWIRKNNVGEELPDVESN